MEQPDGHPGDEPPPGAPPPDELPEGFYKSAAEWWEANGWDLLLDFDRPENVPGYVRGRGCLWAHTALGQPIHVVEIQDGPPSGTILHRILKRRLDRCGYEVTGFDFRASTNGWHALVRLDPHPPTPIETVALQAICGSDPLRESCNLERARAVQAWLVDANRAEPSAAEFWRRRWNVLYEPNPGRVKS